jgi:molybdopterin-containing oxidoreductase family iron-sulfur binding subunit
MDSDKKLEESSLKNNYLGRRNFLTKFASTVFASLVAPAVGIATSDKAHEESSNTGYKLPDYEEIELPEPKPDEDVLIRMMRDLKRALKKPLEQRRWVMVIDLRKCVGCHACTIACVAENKLPPGVVYRPVIEEEIGEFPNVSKRFIPRPCFQCENPPCTPVCPVKATYKRPDGIVVIDYEKCIGCKYCITACPYGARSYDFGEHYTDNTPYLSQAELAPNFEYHRIWARKEHNSPIGNARKCHFCVHRIERGLLPQCVTSCIGRATFFGDKNDPQSLVSELIAKPNAVRLKEELGANPNVYYLL